MDYWFMRARHQASGLEVQRVAVPANAGTGQASADIAAEDMRRFLLDSRLADVGDSSWMIVEVHRLHGWVPRPWHASVHDDLSRVVRDGGIAPPVTPDIGAAAGRAPARPPGGVPPCPHGAAESAGPDSDMPPGRLR
jgi:hypothetical protein